MSQRKRGPDDAGGERDALANTLTSNEDTSTGATIGAGAADDVGRYSIEHEIARGGLGRILAGHDQRLDRAVAVKELLIANPASRDRFAREVAITARLQHPSIVPVYDAGARPGGEPFYVMKLLSGGGTLKELVHAAADLDERLALLPNVIAVADAIAYAHSLGIIHRDIKPSNVLVGRFGETLVIDWGLAKDLTRSDDDDRDLGPFRTNSPDMTTAGSIVGTPQYMSPEQARAEPADARSDVYAIGGLLYHVLCGRPPFESGAVGVVMEQVKHSGPPPLGTRQRGLPSDLLAIVDKAMARNPAARYPTAEELAADLRRFQTGQLVAAQSYSAGRLILRWIRRHRLPIAVAGVALALLTAIAWTSFRRVQRERSAAIAGRNALILQQAEAAAEHDPTLALEWLKRYPADGANWARAQQLAADAFSRGVARHLLPGGPVTAIAVTPDGRELFTAVSNQPVRQWNLASGALVRAADLGSSVDQLHVSADGTRVAICDRDGDVTLWAPESGARQLVHRYAGTAEDITFSPDGHTLASGGSDGVYLFDLRSGRERLVVAGATAAVGLAFSPDGGTLAIPTLKGAIHLRGVAGGTARTLSGHSSAVNSVAFSPDGSVLASVADDGALRVWNLSTGRSRVLDRSDAPLSLVRFSSDGGRIAVGGLDHQIRLWDLTTNQRRVLAGHTDRILALAFAPDGKMLASAGKDGQVRLWDSDSGESVLLLGHAGEVNHLAYSADGRTLASAGLDLSTRVWNLDDLRSRVLGRHDGPAHHVVISPDDRLVATDGSDAIVRLWSLSGAPPRALIGHDQTKDVYGLAFSPDGTLLASAGWDGTARIWRVDNGSAHVLADHQPLVGSVSFSSDGGTAVTAGSDGTIDLWEASSGALIDRLLGHRGAVTAAIFSPVDHTLASVGDDGTVRLWDARTGRGRVLGRHDGAALTVVFAPSGRTIASGGVDATVRVWDVATGAMRILRGHHERISRLAFSPNDDQTLVSTSWDDTVRIWNLQTDQVKVLRGPRDHVRALAFSADGAWIATGSDDHCIHLWNLRDGGYSLLRGMSGPVRSVAFTRSGESLIAAGDDGTVRQWNVAALAPAPLRNDSLEQWLRAKTTAALPEALILDQ